MKKFLILLCALVLLLNIAGCSQKSTSPYGEQIPNAEQLPEATEATQETVEQYDENAILFLCQDRADIEGDRDTFYGYNYKGELLENATTNNAGFFAKNGLAPACDSLTGKIGFVDRTGVFVIEPQWDDAAAFSDDGIALVIIEEENENGGETKKYGYVNDEGEQIVPCIYDDATSFYPKGVALIAVKKEVEETTTDENGETQTYTTTRLRWGAIDKTGSVIIQPQYNKIMNVETDCILCYGDTAQVVYDLCGNVIVSEESCYIDDNHTYQYFQSDGNLYRYIREKTVTEEYPEGKYLFTEERIYTGTEFVYPDLDVDIHAPYIRKERVSTTSSGYGYGIVRIHGESRKDFKEEVLVPYEYDKIIRYGSYYVAIKYKNGDINDHIFDIYNQDIVKTAENIDYDFVWHRVDMFGSNIALPDGYFQVSYYDRKIERTISGIIDYNGEFIVPPQFYRTINLYTYECIGGKFISYT